jgi:hypothetical protein
MDVFICWSKETGKKIAEALETWIPKVIKAVNIPFSDKEMHPDRLWLKKHQKEFASTDFGIICLTPDNLGLDDKWIGVKSGAIYTAPGGVKDHTVVYLHEIEPSEIQEGVYAQFLRVKDDKSGTFKLLETINEAVREKGQEYLDDENLYGEFEANWPNLKNKLEKASKDIPAHKQFGDYSPP